MQKNLETLAQLAEDYSKNLVVQGGYISSITSVYYTVTCLSQYVCLGDFVVHQGKNSDNLGQVIRINLDIVYICPVGIGEEISLGDLVFHWGRFRISPSACWCGRVINALGKPIDGDDSLGKGDLSMEIMSKVPPAMNRQRVEKGFKTGIRVIDIFTPLCHGQRIGVFAGSGIGKSTLLSMFARSDCFDKVIISLVGERGREVREFIEDYLGDNLKKSVVVVATSDESPILRKMAPLTAVTIAEYFSSKGDNVLLILDSITRFAHSIREIATNSGELPVARGYPTSVFSELPRLLERIGPSEKEKGNITAVISVLVDGDNHNDPIADSVRSILDGHIVLNRSLAEEGRYPPVDPLASVSRLADKAWSADEKKLVSSLTHLIHRFEETRDIRLIGGYRPGVDLILDKAVHQVPIIYDFLKQSPSDLSSEDVFQEITKKLQ
ncbi:flagellar protein export ATPase FliI [Candidatus Liberibacter asiaticus]|uniref:Flagellum-specific ATP synthase n=3 Tax=Liberibacter asiaticus TaxID=34021 RepID=C6XFK4_LIBAP|nr:flagellar protein export ATPase FliI [Candidatus Liberibacter asiaticus]ACT57157.1 flagellum-specific ATP synthase [Candidatus Liberibacter asiaticus str. psy62]AGH16880.1 flagellum-specific ATP synthase [Candidatus Liberibacter asiaticus str. gxpsy]ALK07233.1 flagellar protein export ATPase FliI [Candidatus Liberibacter asiaticus]ASK52718.1 flagellum-specific ATP synthase FliI [Candidatus Liberibacter asiaticus]AWL14041.1 flagellar protein export ATPase FliI [Candidatus Liberibacter asiati